MQNPGEALESIDPLAADQAVGLVVDKVLETGLTLGFAFQDIAVNFIAGIVLSIRRPIHVGDVVETNDFFCTVGEINLRSTLLETPTGQTVVIPTNWS